MATKHDCSCLKKAGDNEPIFVLRAQDLLAPETVRHWIALARERGANPAMLAEAERCAVAMETWPTRKVPD